MFSANRDPRDHRLHDFDNACTPHPSINAPRRLLKLLLSVLDQMSESFYTSGQAPSFPGVASSSPSPSSPITSGAPPPPPPKPVSHLQSQSQTQSADPSRSGTPVLSSAPVPVGTGSPRPQPPPPTTYSPAISNPAQLLPPQQAQRVHTPIPPPSLSDRWIPPQLQEKPLSELQPLLNNPALLASLAATHPSYSSSLVPLQSAVQANVQLAQQLTQVENQLRQLRDETAQLLLNHTSLQTQWRRKQTEMDDALSPWGPRQMYQRLLSSISEQEALLRAMEESFLEGPDNHDAYYGGGNGKASEKEVTEWVRRIREGATTLAKRREMRGRWDEGRVGGWR